MDKKKKILATVVSALVVGIVLQFSGIGLGSLMSSTMSPTEVIQKRQQLEAERSAVQEQMDSVRAQIKDLENQKKSAIEGGQSAVKEVTARLTAANKACIAGRGNYDKAVSAASIFEKGMSDLTAQYNGYVAARDAAQTSLKANNATIDNNNKVIIPGLQKEQKKFKSTSQDYKDLTGRITAVRNENTRLTKLNTDPKTGFQKQINDATTQINKMNLKTSEFSKKKVELERLKKVASSTPLPVECAQVTALTAEKATKEAEAKTAQQNIQATIKTIDDQIAELRTQSIQLTGNQNYIASQLNKLYSTGTKQAPSVAPVVREQTLEEVYEAKWTKLSADQEVARSARAAKLQTCLESVNINAEDCESMYSENSVNAGCGNGAMDFPTCRLCPVGEVLDYTCTSREGFDMKLTSEKQERVHNAALQAEADRQAAEQANIEAQAQSDADINLKMGNGGNKTSTGDVCCVCVVGNDSATDIRDSNGFKQTCSWKLSQPENNDCKINRIMNETEFRNITGTLTGDNQKKALCGGFLNSGKKYTKLRVFHEEHGQNGAELIKTCQEIKGLTNADWTSIDVTSDACMLFDNEAKALQAMQSIQAKLLSENSSTQVSMTAHQNPTLADIFTGELICTSEYTYRVCTKKIKGTAGPCNTAGDMCKTYISDSPSITCQENGQDRSQTCVKNDPACATDVCVGAWSSPS